jgi:peptidoglycan/xylan/chitin deacetylase (PgdA/CDA1 family)
MRFFRNLILNLVYAFIRYSGISYVIIKSQLKNKVSILVYHNPGVKAFEKHLKYLSNKFNFTSISDLSQAIYNDRWDRLPKYPLVITIDDGWKENFDLIQILQNYKLRPTIYLTSHLINTNRCFWTTICKTEDKVRMKKMSNRQRLIELWDRYQYYPEKEFPESRQVLDRNELEQMKDFVDFGLHTCFHPILSNCDRDEKYTEIFESKKRVEEFIGTTIEAFAYPNGNYDDECINILKEIGIKSARTIDFGSNTNKTDPLKLKAIGVTDNGTINKLAAELTGIPYFFQNLFQ